MRLVSIVAVCCALSVSMRATSFIATDLSELTREARTIARGRVVSVESPALITPEPTRPPPAASKHWSPSKRSRT